MWNFEKVDTIDNIIGKGLESIVACSECPVHDECISGAKGFERDKDCWQFLREWGMREAEEENLSITELIILQRLNAAYDRGIKKLAHCLINIDPDLFRDIVNEVKDKLLNKEIGHYE